MRYSRILVVAFFISVTCLARAQTPGEAFSFLVGPYPSKGLFEYDLNCGEFRKAHPAAARWILTVESGGKTIVNRTEDLAGDGRAHGFVEVGAMADGAGYSVRAVLVDKAEAHLAEQSASFTRKVMAFETAGKAGMSDVVVAPFTAPVVKDGAVSCWGRTYQHGRAGLLVQLTAAGREVLARPAVFFARAGAGELVALVGDEPKLVAVGVGKVGYKQMFSGAGITLNVVGDFDYDGFYKFTVSVAPGKDAVELKDLRLELPFKESVAQLIEASVTWRRSEGTQKECMGELEKKQGVLWDSKTFPSRNWPRIGNMPPFVWLGDDERGLVYSCASEEGMHNDENAAAATVERKNGEVVYTAWFVNSPLKLEKARTFQFALQGSPFKAMPEKARLWRNQNYRMPYKDGVLFTNWFTDGSYPTYGRFLTLPLLKKYAAATGADQVGVMASSMSECGGTPEYLQFWHEWGSELGWDKAPRQPPEEWAVKMLKEAELPINPYVRVESASNVSVTNRDYRVWWFDQEIRNAGISYIYQDNPTYGYSYDPPNGYGYVRDDGRKEPTSAIWNSRTFMKRIATTAVEAGKTDSPYIWANAISPVLPGRSFCRRMLNGEYLYTKLFTLGQIRVMASKQWGMELDWYPFPQTEESSYPNIGPVRKYWRAVYGRLLLHDITSFSNEDDVAYSKRWINALDLFWLDDPTVAWHPYYQADAMRSAHAKTTQISSYTAKGRALLFVSNQGEDAVVDSVPVEDLGLTHFYDAETGEEIENGDGGLKLFIPASDYRVVIGLAEPWKFAAKNALGVADLPAQSSLDPEETLSAISRQLLTSATLKPVQKANRLYEEWMKKVMAELGADGSEVVYLDATACGDVAFGKGGIQCSVFYDKKIGAILVNYFNDSNDDVSLSGKVRDQIAKKVGKQGHSYIIHPVTGISEWAFIDIPAHRGLLEIYYSDSQDYGGAHNGPFKAGNMFGNIKRAVDARQIEMHGRPLK